MRCSPAGGNAPYTNQQPQLAQPTRLVAAACATTRRRAHDADPTSSHATHHTQHSDAVHTCKSNLVPVWCPFAAQTWCRMSRRCSKTCPSHCTRQHNIHDVAGTSLWADANQHKSSSPTPQTPLAAAPHTRVRALNCLLCTLRTYATGTSYGRRCNNCCS